MRLQGLRAGRRRSTVAGVALASVAALAAPLLTAGPAAAVGGKTMAIGAYATGGTAELGRIEHSLGKRFEIDHEYIVFGQQSITGKLGDDRARGRTPYVNMALNCGCRSGKKGSAAAHNYWKAVAAGRYDGWLITQARAVRAWGRPFAITWQHEPEQSYGWEGTPADFQRAWRHIVSLFRAQGASNARFVTSFLPTSYRGPRYLADRYWPGSAYVDIVGSTGYNWACSAHTGNKPGCGKGWKSFAAVFGPVNAWVTTHGLAAGKHWWVTETGVAEDPSKPGRKAQWINDMQRTADSWPALSGVVFFFGSRSHDLFLPGTSTSSLNAFKWAMAEWV